MRTDYQVPPPVSKVRKGMLFVFNIMHGLLKKYDAKAGES